MYKVTAIGEILYDVYPDKKRLGGAPFNFIYHIWKIIGKANFISNVGNDENGNEMLSFLTSIGFNTAAISVDEMHPTGIVKVELDESKTPHFTISLECCFDYLRLNTISEEIFENNTDILYFGTFTARKGVSRKTLLTLLNRKDKKYFCDLNLRHDFYTKQLLEEILPSCNVVKLNQEELDILKIYFRLEENNDIAAVQLIDKFNIDLIGLTLGSDGAVLYTKEEKNKCKIELNNVVDTLGAGDAFAAILCLGYLKKIKLEVINKLANEFAGEICSIHGALPKNDVNYLKLRESLV